MIIVEGVSIADDKELAANNIEFVKKFNDGSTAKLKYKYGPWTSHGQLRSWFGQIFGGMPWQTRLRDHRGRRFLQHGSQGRDAIQGQIWQDEEGNYWVYTWHDKWPAPPDPKEQESGTRAQYSKAKKALKSKSPEEIDQAIEVMQDQLEDITATLSKLTKTAKRYEAYYKNTLQDIRKLRYQYDDPNATKGDKLRITRQIKELQNGLNRKRELALEKEDLLERAQKAIAKREREIERLTQILHGEYEEYMKGRNQERSSSIEDNIPDLIDELAKTEAELVNLLTKIYFKYNLNVKDEDASNPNAYLWSLSYKVRRGTTRQKKEAAQYAERIKELVEENDLLRDNIQDLAEQLKGYGSEFTIDDINDLITSATNRYLEND